MMMYENCGRYVLFWLAKDYNVWFCMFSIAFRYGGAKPGYRTMVEPKKIEY